MVKETDRYKLTDKVVDGFVSPGRTRYGVWKVPRISLAGHSRYLVKASDLMRPDLIAFSVYGKSTYWWVIMYVNKIANPFVDLSAGLVLKIPRLEAVTSALSDSPKGS